jgi:PIN domain nuclease of toxin-antitoxin system
VTTSVLDASAVLAHGHGEEGAEVVDEYLDGAAISTVNWSEILRRSGERGVQGPELRAALRDAGVTFVPFVESDAETAARFWESTRRLGLSLADRACLALADRLGVPAVTADRAWTLLDLGVDVVCIR